MEIVFLKKGHQLILNDVQSDRQSFQMIPMWNPSHVLYPDTSLTETWSNRLRQNKKKKEKLSLLFTHFYFCTRLLDDPETCLLWFEGAHGKNILQRTHNTSHSAPRESDTTSLLRGLRKGNNIAASYTCKSAPLIAVSFTHRPIFFLFCWHFLHSYSN